ncbi:uncharacterized protein PG986_013721 [Apiospora aurea]|uniref:SET domain-containing protein n=1 Tax=Apiospora aurea TaxID=335848 RepID=A0ABR1PWE7_9PEZI
MESTYRLNWNVEIRQCGDKMKCLGLFATHRLTKGLKVVSEEPLLVYESRDELVAAITQQLPQLPEAGQQLFALLYAGHRDVAALLPAGAVRDTQATKPRRLRQIAQLNSFEGIGIGCLLSPGLAAINHDCAPNAFMYYNPNTGSVNLHALHDIDAGEEISVSYFQEGNLKAFRDVLTQYHRLESPSMADTRLAIATSRQLVGVLEQEGLVGLDMSQCLAEQARMFATLGDNESEERVNRQAMIIRRLCVGFDHPSCILNS